MVDKVDIEEEEKCNLKSSSSVSLLNKLQYPESNVNDSHSQQEQLAAVLTNNNNATSAAANNNSRPGAHHLNGTNFDTTTEEGTRDVSARGGVLFVPGDSILQRSSPGSNNMAEVSADVDVEATPICPGESI